MGAPLLLSLALAATPGDFRFTFEGAQVGADAPWGPAFVQTGPVPFSDTTARGLGEASLQVEDRVAGLQATYGDKATLRARFRLGVDEVEVVLRSAGFAPGEGGTPPQATPVGGGVVVDAPLYGWGGLGGFASMTPVQAAAAVWGTGEVYRNGELVTDRARVHVAAVTAGAHAEDETFRLLPQARAGDLELYVLATGLPSEAFPQGFLQLFFDQDVRIRRGDEQLSEQTALADVTPGYRTVDPIAAALAGEGVGGAGLAVVPPFGPGSLVRLAPEAPLAPGLNLPAVVLPAPGVPAGSAAQPLAAGAAAPPVGALPATPAPLNAQLAPTPLPATPAPANAQPGASGAAAAGPTAVGTSVAGIAPANAVPGRVSAAQAGDTLPTGTAVAGIAPANAAPGAPAAGGPPTDVTQPVPGIAPANALPGTTGAALPGAGGATGGIAPANAVPGANPLAAGTATGGGGAAGTTEGARFGPGATETAGFGPGAAGPVRFGPGAAGGTFGPGQAAATTGTAAEGVVPGIAPANVAPGSNPLAPTPVLPGQQVPGVGPVNATPATPLLPTPQPLNATPATPLPTTPPPLNAR